MRISLSVFLLHNANEYVDNEHILVMYFVMLCSALLDQVCSATGQLFIYHTISVFGPVVFIIIMTIRQVSAQHQLSQNNYNMNQ